MERQQRVDVYGSKRRTLILYNRSTLCWAVM